MGQMPSAVGGQTLEPSSSLGQPHEVQAVATRSGKADATSGCFCP